MSKLDGELEASSRVPPEVGPSGYSSSRVPPEVGPSGYSSSRVPPEVYELLSLVVDFAQDLDEVFGASSGRGLTDEGENFSL